MRQRHNPIAIWLPLLLSSLGISLNQFACESYPRIPTCCGWISEEAFNAEMMNFMPTKKTVFSLLKKVHIWCHSNWNESHEWQLVAMSINFLYSAESVQKPLFVWTRKQRRLHYSFFKTLKNRSWMCSVCLVFMEFVERFFSVSN